MSVSEVTYHGRSFTAHDAHLRLWLELILREIDQVESADWLTELRDDWDDQASRIVDFGIDLELDTYLETKDRQEIVCAAANRVQARVSKVPDPVPVASLNALGTELGEEPFSQELPREPLEDVAWDFIDLLEGEEDGTHAAPWRHELDALGSILRDHQAWLRDPTLAARLKLKDFTGQGVSFSGCDLRRARFLRVSLSRGDLSGANLSQSELACSDLRGAILTGANLTRARIRETALDDAHMESTVFDRAELIGASMARVQSSRASFDQTFLSNVSMASADLQHSRVVAVWESCDLRDANLSEALLRDTHFRSSDLRGAAFSGTAMLSGGFRGCRLYGVHGIPFLFDRIGGADLDFSRGGGWRDEDGLRRLCDLLGGGRARGPYGTAADTSLYRVREAGEGGSPRYAVERIEDAAEVIEIATIGTSHRRLAITYRIKQPRYGDAIARLLIYQLVLMGILQDVHRGQVDEIRFENLESARAEVSTYGEPL